MTVFVYLSSMETCRGEQQWIQRITNETITAITEWLNKNVGENLGYSWYSGERYGSAVLGNSGHLEKNG